MHYVYHYKLISVNETEANVIVSYHIWNRFKNTFISDTFGHSLIYVSVCLHLLLEWLNDFPHIGGSIRGQTQILRGTCIRGQKFIIIYSVHQKTLCTRRQHKLGNDIPSEYNLHRLRKRTYIKWGTQPPIEDGLHCKKESIGRQTPLKFWPEK